MEDIRAWAAYRTRIEEMRRALVELPDGAPIRLRKGATTSNLFRPRAAEHTALAADGLSGVLSIDRETLTADVLGMTTYEDLVAATLPHGLMPLVVPQLKTITLGGAVTGLGIESSSFRNGLPHESVLELDVLIGDGRIVTADPDGEHRDLYYGFPNSYGTLGYALRLRISLEPVEPYVRLRHVRLTDVSQAVELIESICATSSYDGEPVQFLDGTWFSAGESYLTLGAFSPTAPSASSYTGQDIYYRSIQHRLQDWLTTQDYLWRWDTDWFWCSRAFGAQNPTLRRIWPSRWRRSDVYWRIVGLERRYGIRRRIDAARGLPDREEVIQDVEVPVARLPELMEFLDRQTGIEPVWWCPLRQRDPAAVYPLYPLAPDAVYVNVGFWQTVALPPGESDGFHNRAIEREVARLGGRKSLYSTAFYSEEEFAASYGGPAYEVLKKTYDPDGRLLGLYEKTVLRR